MSFLILSLTNVNTWRRTIHPPCIGWNFIYPSSQPYLPVRSGCHIGVRKLLTSIYRLIYPTINVFLCFPITKYLFSSFFEFLIFCFLFSVFKFGTFPNTIVFKIYPRRIKIKKKQKEFLMCTQRTK